MTTQTENTTPAQGTWAARAQDTLVHRDTAGDENLTAVFNHDSETGVPTLRMNGTAAVRVVVNGRALLNPTDAQREDLVAELTHLEVTVDGASTDDELEALNAALDSALRMLGMTRE